VNEIKNALAVPIEDPANNTILRNALEVCNNGDISTKLKLHLIMSTNQKSMYRTEEYTLLN
jgi:hypothetical protein